MDNTMTGMEYKIHAVAARIRELREISGFTVEEMAQRTGVSVEEYIACGGNRDQMDLLFSKETNEERKAYDRAISARMGGKYFAVLLCL